MVQSSGYEINRFGALACSMVMPADNCITYLRAAEGIVVNVVGWMEVVVNTTVIIVLQFINVSNHRMVHLKLTQCHLSITSQ